MGCLSTKSRKGARRSALVFALLTVFFLAVDVTFMVFGAMYCEGKRRPYVWLRHGYGCLLRTANLGFIVAWIVAAAQDSVHRMQFCSMAMATRIVGETISGCVDFIWGKLFGYELLHHLMKMEANSGIHVFFSGLYIRAQRADSFIHLIQLVSLHHEEPFGILLFLHTYASFKNMIIIRLIWSNFVYLTIAIEVVFVALLLRYQSGLMQSLSAGSATVQAQPSQTDAASGPERTSSAAIASRSRSRQSDETRPTCAVAALPSRYPVQA